MRFPHHPRRAVAMAALTWMALALAACGSTKSVAHTNPTATATAVVPTLATAQLTIQAHKKGAIGLAWSPDGKRLASCGDDGAAQVWDATSGAPVWSAPYTSAGDFLRRVVARWHAHRGGRL